MNGDAANRRVLCNIARTAFKVINRILARDQLLASKLRSETTGSRQIYREECITVEMATTLRESFPKNVEITLFTPSEEARTGADWYWRFEKGDRAVHARVQAKRVQRTVFGQPDSDGHVDINQDQLNQLIEANKKASSQLPKLQAWLATFARFEARPPCMKDDLSDCPRHHHTEACASHDPSLWIAQACDMRNLSQAQVPVKTVVEHSVRLDCILPCIDGTGATDGPAAKGFTLAASLQPYKDCIDIIHKDTALLKYFEGALRIFV